MTKRKAGQQGDGPSKKRSKLAASLGALLGSQARKPQHLAERSGKPKPKATEEHAKAHVVPYSEADSFLLVGEGNFSFAHALSQLFPGASLAATAYDSREVAAAKYPDLSTHLDGIAEHNADAEILFDIDATKLEAEKALKKKRFSRIVFQFPHVGAGEKDEARNVRLNQTLLLGFFRSASALLAAMAKVRRLRPSVATIDVTLKEEKPYSLWEIKKLAKEAGLVTVQSFEFPLAIYSELGYAHRRTLGFEEGLSPANNEELAKAALRTYSFVRATDLAGGSGAVAQAKKARKGGNESD
ncbi:hypothetical protein DFJ74DRAFT_604072 [Hyaloraphidium curvatum]|nr:hypothetical protein DFJ74DRAFT_604072 [Hyaloraphidium curvatum]